MDLFTLPHTARVNRVIPKNAFDSYTTAKQKKLFTDLIARITWTHKLSTDTVNLEAKDIKEIQVFRIELKVKEEILTILDIIDKSIPYNIVFVIEFDSRIYISTSTKHSHPVNEDKAIIDWTFKTGWFRPSENKYTLQLKKSIDAVYHDFCIQLSGKSSMATRSLQDLIAYKKKVDALEKEISRLKSGMANSRQFNNKVELNLKLKAKEDELQSLLSDH
jgi:hypothetical protein